MRIVLEILGGMKSKQEILDTKPFSRHVNMGSSNIKLRACVYVEEREDFIEYWSLNPVIIDDLHKERGLKVQHSSFRPFSAKKVYILIVPKTEISH